MKCLEYVVDVVVRVVKMHSTSDSQAGLDQKLEGHNYAFLQTSIGEQAPGQALTHYAPG